MLIENPSQGLCPTVDFFRSRLQTKENRRMKNKRKGGKGNIYITINGELFLTWFSSVQVQWRQWGVYFPHLPPSPPRPLRRRSNTPALLIRELDLFKSFKIFKTL